MSETQESPSPDPGELLIAVCQSALREIVLIDGWQRLVAVGSVGTGNAGMFAYSFDAQGNSQAGSPRGETVRALKALHKAMSAADPDGRAWCRCLILIGSDGRLHVDFEYDDAQRWAVTPANLHERMAEFAALRIDP